MSLPLADLLTRVLSPLLWALGGFNLRHVLLSPTISSFSFSANYPGVGSLPSLL